MQTLKGIAIALIGCALLMYLCTMIVPPQPTYGQATFAPLQCTQSTPVSSATSVQVITANTGAAVPAQYIYICSVSLGSIGGSSFSIVEGTGSVCATNTVALAGGTTAATGYGIAANGSPVQFGGGIGPVMRTKTPGDNVCLIIAGTGPLAGTVAFAQQPF